MQLLSLLAFSSAFSRRQADSPKLIDCYGVNGFVYPNNVKCPTSNSLRNAAATCLPNRLCHNLGDGPETFVRGPCSIFPYDATACAEICLYNETVVHGGTFPRVRPCADGSLCCSNDPQCCENRRGVFLDNNGNVATAAPITSTTSSIVSTSTTAISVATTSATGTPSPTPTPPPAAEDTTGLKVGLGVGIPVAALVAGLAVWFFLRRRKARSNDRPRELAAGDGSYPNQQHDYKVGEMYGSPGHQSELYAQVPPQEMADSRMPPQKLPRGHSQGPVELA